MVVVAAAMAVIHTSKTRQQRQFHRCQQAAKAVAAVDPLLLPATLLEVVVVEEDQLPLSFQAVVNCLAMLEA